MDPDPQHWLLGSWVAIAATVAVTVAPIIIAAAAGLLLLLRSLAVLWNFIVVEFCYADLDPQHWLIGSWVANAAMVAVTVDPIIIAAAAGLLLLLQLLSLLLPCYCCCHC